jgi:very-short-patch-repair endonuclease
MNEFRNRSLTENSRRLRREMTAEEKHLWYDFLKDLPVTVHRQKIIGKYIVDFSIPKNGLIIELDGSQHYIRENHENDTERDFFLSEKGFTVLRYTNRQIKEKFREVCEDILNHLKN